MRKRVLAALSIAPIAALSVLAASPAQAYDVNLYAYAAGHLVQTSDIPGGLGEFGDGMNLSGNTGQSQVTICTGKDTSVTLSGGKAYFNGNFSNGGDGGNTINETVTVYKSGPAAIKAFDKVKAALKTCDGVQTGSWDDGAGSTYTYSSSTTSGIVPSVTVTGVPSLFVNTNYIDGAAGSSSPSARDAYMVVTLVDNVVITTFYERADDSNVSTKMRKKVNSIAFAAVGRWVE